MNGMKKKLEVALREPNRFWARAAVFRSSGRSRDSFIKRALRCGQGSGKTLGRQANGRRRHTVEAEGSSNAESKTERNAETERSDTSESKTKAEGSERGRQGLGQKSDHQKKAGESDCTGGVEGGNGHTLGQVCTMVTMVV